MKTSTPTNIFQKEQNQGKELNFFFVLQSRLCLFFFNLKEGWENNETVEEI